MPRRSKLWLWGLEQSAVRSFGVLSLGTCTFSLCTSGSFCAYSRPSMPTVVTSFLGACTTSFHSGLERITTTSIMRSLSVIMQAASGGGITCLTLNIHLRLSSDEGSKSLQRVPRRLSRSPDNIYYEPTWSVDNMCFSVMLYPPFS